MNAAGMSAPPLLDIRGLTKVFGGFTAVAEVDLAVRPGTIHSVIGPNGAGKTTLFRTVTGTHRPTRGTVRFDGRDLTGAPPHIVSRRGLAQSFQITNVFPRLTVLESVQVAVLARHHRSWNFVSAHRQRLAGEAAELLSEVGLAAAADAQAQTLSHGDQRILEVALALATRPRLLLLDEPTAGMSPAETGRMASLVTSLAATRGLTVVLCEHDMDIVFGISHEVTVLHRGRVISHGPPAQVQADPLVAEVYLGGGE
jgi:branched-chain amino acid transport system ATP-binding protein